MKTRFTGATKGPAVLLLTTFVVSFLVSGIANSCWEFVPLSERIRNADLVVLGQLINVEPKYYGITWNLGDESQEVMDIFDIGEIRVDRFIKGDYHAGNLGFAFDNTDQPNHPHRHMKIAGPDPALDTRVRICYDLSR